MTSGVTAEAATGTPMNAIKDALNRSRAGSRASSPAHTLAGATPPPLGVTAATLSALRPFDTAAVKVLLLENVSETARGMLVDAGYQVEHHKKALPTEVLKEKIRDVHAIGIRSKTKLTRDVLAAAEKLVVIGCFCIGTNQVDLPTASARGIAVFNSPFSNSRSVAELVLGELIALARQIGDRNTEMHAGVWRRNPIGAPAALSAALDVDPGSPVHPLRSHASVTHLQELAAAAAPDAVTDTKAPPPTFEIRGKILGIVGYGHIGSQLAVLAEAFGMRIIYYDVNQMMPLGNSVACSSLEELLRVADFVTLHVPETPLTKNFIDAPQIALMKRGSFLLNLCRGSVVNIPAAVAALDAGHLAGAAFDVYPSEPHANGPGFVSELQGRPNVILTPHIGGSTEEAQRAIGVEVAGVLTKFINLGATVGAVNFPEVELRVAPPAPPAAAAPDRPRTVRILNVHHNVPGVLKQINRILSEFNIEKQICDSRDGIGYIMADVSVQDDADLGKLDRNLRAIPESIQVRLLWS